MSEHVQNSTPAIEITASKNYDSEFCGSIPLHLVNLIQPHGILLVADIAELRLVQASENIETRFSISLDELLEKPLSHFLSLAQFEDVKEKIVSGSREEKIPLSLDFAIQGKTVAFTVLIHIHARYIIMELEEIPAHTPQASFNSLYQQIKYITSTLKQASTTLQLADIAVKQLKKFSGFDRIMIYQFDSLWNGTVIAEAKEEDMDSYLDLRFPASDVPKQARDLYFKNPYRLIPTRNYTPVRLIPVLNPLSLQFTDLSDCNLRSVAPVHLEYLTNLHICASMSLPIIIEDRLWGLISCHHKSDKNLSYEQRSALEIISGIISVQLAAKEKEKTILLRAKLSATVAKIVEQLYSRANFMDALLDKSAHVLDLLSLTGAALIYDDSIHTIGSTPKEEAMTELTAWLRRKGLEQLFVTDTLPKLYEASKPYKDLASGLMALPLNTQQGEYLLGFRPEVLQTVSWGGNPNEAIQLEKDGKTYHPRHSFAIYQETVKHTSLPFHKEEIAAAEFLRNVLIERLLKDKH